MSLPLPAVARRARSIQCKHRWHLSRHNITIPSVTVLPCQILHTNHHRPFRAWAILYRPIICLYSASSLNQPARSRRPKFETPPEFLNLTSSCNFFIPFQYLIKSPISLMLCIASIYYIHPSPSLFSSVMSRPYYRCFPSFLQHTLSFLFSNTYTKLCR